MLSALVIPRRGATGAAATTVVTEIVVLALLARAARPLLGMGVSDRGQDA